MVALAEHQSLTPATPVRRKHTKDSVLGCSNVATLMR
jgi:hypothetical protein